MFSSIQKKSFRDLSRNKTRTFFTILTIALGVMGIALFAVNPLAQEAADKKIEESNMYDALITVNDVSLSEDQLEDLRNLDNVNDVEARVQFYTRMYIGERREPAQFIGVTNFVDQKVDIIDVSVDNPGEKQVLSSGSNLTQGIYEGQEGDSFRAIDSTGQEQELSIVGEGNNLIYMSDTLAIFFADIEAVRDFSGIDGYNSLSFDFDKTDKESAEKTIEDIRAYLVTNTSVVAFANLPEVRDEGEWRGQEILDIIMGMMYSLTILALFCSIFLISNTMNTLIAEQRKEIAQMKAIGATRFQIFKFYLTVSFLLGAIGATIGATLGIFVSFLILQTVGTQMGLDPEISVHMPTVLISILVGIIIVILASLPALIKSIKVTVAEGLRTHGISAKFGKSIMDKLLILAQIFPKTVQMGLRNAARNKGRSISTILQVSLAIGVFIGLLSTTNSLEIAVTGAYGDWNADVQLLGGEDGGKILTEDSAIVLQDFEQIEIIEPFIETTITINERDINTMGFTGNATAYNHEKNLEKGEWISQKNDEQRDKVMVIGRAISILEELEVGDKTTIMTATGPYEFEVIGIDAGLMNNGQMVYMPLSTLQDTLQKGRIVSGFYIQTVSKDHDDIDKLATEAEDRMLESGHMTISQINYVEEEKNQTQNAGIGNLMFYTSSIIVFISLVGLMGSLTMNILERTREIGMLRCIGAKSKNIRMIFSSEGVFLSLVGWGLGIPGGYLIGLGMWSLLANSLKADVPYYFATDSVLLSLLVTIIGSILIIQLPIRRATKLKPGDALRYE